MLKNVILWKITYKNDFGFLGKNSAPSLFYTWNRLTCCKKSEKNNHRKYENFCYIGEREGGERKEAILKDQNDRAKNIQIVAKAAKLPKNALFVDIFPRTNFCALFRKNLIWIWKVNARKLIRAKFYKFTGSAIQKLMAWTLLLTTLPRTLFEFL